MHMSLPTDPISGGLELDNPGFGDRWTCPNCYANHTGRSQRDSIIRCGCGATLKLTIEQQPVCRATCVDPDDLDDE
jgi:hypothetical protein